MGNLAISLVTFEHMRSHQPVQDFFDNHVWLWYGDGPIMRIVQANIDIFCIIHIQETYLGNRETNCNQ